MQTAPLQDLRQRPLEALFYLHIQPPALDVLRAGLAQLWPSLPDMELLHRVDQGLYIAWALVYALAALLIFTWLEQAANWRWALPATLLFLLHPALIFYSTFLEATLLTSAGVLWLFYNLWALHRDPARSIWPVTLSAVLLFFTRSIFQWPFVLLLAGALLLLKAPYRRIALFVLVAGSLAGSYTLKQWLLFDLPSTSSFTGMSLLRSIGCLDQGLINQEAYFSHLDRLPDAALQDAALPTVLTRAHKLTGTPNFNHFRYLELDRQLTQQYRQCLAEKTPNDLLYQYALNFRIFLQPSSVYTPHVIVDRLPWRASYDRIFSFPVLLLLALFSLLAGYPAIRRQARAALGLLLPAGWILFASIFAESGENMRFKFFLEPVWFCFFTIQIYTMTQAIIQQFARLRTPSGEK